MPDEPNIYSTQYNCPEHGVPLKWRRGRPKEHLCPSGKHVVTGVTFDREWRIKQITSSHRANRRRLHSLGVAYAFTGDERYARKSRDILLAYTRTFPSYPWHGGPGVTSGPKATACASSMSRLGRPAGSRPWRGDTTSWRRASASARRITRRSSTCSRRT